MLGNVNIMSTGAFFIYNPEEMTNFHMISIRENEMKNQICNIIRDFVILDTALLPTTCKQEFSKKPFSLIKTIWIKVKEEALTLYENFF